MTTATMPAMRSLGTLADLKPCLIRDTREQQGLTFRRLPCVSGTLQTGDYSLVGCEHLFAVERKSLSDLAASITGGRERFERELCRLRGYEFKRLLIIGSEQAILRHEYTSNATPKSVLHTLWAYEIRYSTAIVFADTPDAGARLIERWAYFFAREQVERCNVLLRSHKHFAGRSAMDTASAEDPKRSGAIRH